MKSRFVVSTLVKLLFLAIVPLSSAEEKGPRYGGSLTVSNDKGLQGLNPLQVNVRQGNNYRFFDFILEGLVGISKNDELVPSLGESWEVSPDGTRYVFQVRKGVKFHHGRELAADDVKWNFDRILDPKTRNPQRRVFSLLKSVEATGPHTITFHLARSFVPFLEKLAANYAPIMAKESLPTVASQGPVGTGPFEFAGAVSGEVFRLKRFAHYWQKGIPYLDEVLYKTIPDGTARATALRVGDTDVVNDLPIQVVDKLQREKVKEIRFFISQTGLSWLKMNNAVPPFHDVRVRQAIAYALNKQEIIDAVTWGFGFSTNQRYPKGHPWYIEVKDREQDLEKARSLLREAGYPNGFSLVSITYPGGEDHEVTQIVQSQLKKVGIEVRIQLMEYVAHTAAVNRREFSLVAGGGGIYVDPDGFYKRRFHSEENWQLGYKNLDVDRLLDEAQKVNDTKKRKELYTKMLEIVQKEVPAIFLGLTPYVDAARSHVRGYEPNFSGSINYTTGGVSRAWIEK
jgi:peptide/nickel transport system substrate-binding protein